MIRYRKFPFGYFTLYIIILKLRPLISIKKQKPIIERSQTRDHSLSTLQFYTFSSESPKKKTHVSNSRISILARVSSNRSLRVTRCPWSRRDRVPAIYLFIPLRSRRTWSFKCRFLASSVGTEDRRSPSLRIVSSSGRPIRHLFVPDCKHGRAMRFLSRPFPLPLRPAARGNTRTPLLPAAFSSLLPPPLLSSSLSSRAAAAITRSWKNRRVVACQRPPHRFTNESGLASLFREVRKHRR